MRWAARMTTSLPDIDATTLMRIKVIDCQGNIFSRHAAHYRRASQHRRHRLMAINK